MSKGLFAKKSIGSLLKETSDTKHGLKRALGPLNLTAIGIGAVIGAGLFVLTGQAAAHAAGPGVILSFIIAAIISTFAALCYAEFAALIPVAGSAYTYAYVTLGEFAAWFIGWGLTLEYLFSLSTVASGWSGYLVSVLKDFGMVIPEMFTKAPIAYVEQVGWISTGGIINLPAVLIIAVIGALVVKGIQIAAFLNDILVFIKLGVIALFIICGVAFINTENWTPFIPPNTGVFGEFGWSGILRGAGIVFFAFLGFDALSTMAQEAKNPQKDMPIGMLGSLGICTFVYILFALVLTGMISYTALGVSDPIAVAVNTLGPNFVWLRYVVKFAILAGLTSVILVMLMGQARIFFTMAHDGLLPPSFGKLHPVTRIPFFSTVIVMLLGMVMAGFFPVDILGALTSMGALLAFLLVCFGVLVLRFTQPNLHRPFKTPWTPWIPLLGTIFTIVIMLAMPGVTWMQFIIWMLIGCAIYYLYGRKHSKVRNGA
jgi:APA family basic amino acid/polyamine antiporter